MSVQEMKPIKEGKVREIYDNGDTLIMVATDRISCFDVILDNTVTKKGTVLTQMSKFWFDMTEDVIPNHMVSADVKDMPEFFRQPKFDGNSMMCKKLNMLLNLQNCWVTVFGIQKLTCKSVKMLNKVHAKTKNVSLLVLKL